MQKNLNSFKRDYILLEHQWSSWSWKQYHHLGEPGYKSIVKKAIKIKHSFVAYSEPGLLNVLSSASLTFTMTSVGFLVFC